MALPFMILSAARRAALNRLAAPDRLALADGRYGAGGNHQLLSASLAIGIAGGVAAVLMLALVTPTLTKTFDDPTIIKTIIDPPKLPEPKPRPQTKPSDSAPQTRITTVVPRFDPVDHFSGPVVPLKGGTELRSHCGVSPGWSVVQPWNGAVRRKPI